MKNVKGKEWLQKELSKLVAFKTFNQTKFNYGHNPVVGKYDMEEVDNLVAQLGEPLEADDKK